MKQKRKSIKHLRLELWKKFSLKEIKEAISMILSSTGLEQSMVKETPPFFFPFEAAARLILTPLLSLYIPKPY